VRFLEAAAVHDVSFIIEDRLDDRRDFVGVVFEIASWMMITFPLASRMPRATAAPFPVRHLFEQREGVLRLQAP